MWSFDVHFFCVCVSSKNVRRCHSLPPVDFDGNQDSSLAFLDGGIGELHEQLRYFANMSLCLIDLESFVELDVFVYWTVINYHHHHY